MSRKLAVVLTGGILGIIAMRLVVGQLLRLIRRYPALVDGAFVIIGWVALKLGADYAFELRVVPWEIPQSLSLTLIVLIFGSAYLYARRRPSPPDDDRPAARRGGTYRGGHYTGREYPSVQNWANGQR